MPALKNWDEEIRELEKEVQRLTDEWTFALSVRDLIKAKDLEDRLIAAQTELNTIKMRRPV